MASPAFGHAELRFRAAPDVREGEAFVGWRGPVFLGWVCLRRLLVGGGWSGGASGGSSPEGQISGMAAPALVVGWVGKGWFWLPSRRPPSGLSHRPKGALILSFPRFSVF